MGSDLLTWMRCTERPQDQAYVSRKLRVHSFPQGRGLGAMDTIAANEEIIRIPHWYLLNRNVILAHVLGIMPDVYLKEIPSQECRDGNPNRSIYEKMEYEELAALLSFQVVTMFLCLERDYHQSYWARFMDLLPGMESFALMPLVWQVLQWENHAQYVEMLPRDAQKGCQDIYKRFAADYQKVRDVISTKLDLDLQSIDDVVSIETYLWCWLCVNSRCLYMDLPGVHDRADKFTMAPYVDLINHSAHDHCKIDIDSQGFHVTSTTGYTSGDQVFLSYGPHSNVFLVNEFGFYLEDNRWNDVDISDDIIDILTPNQAQFLEQHGYFGDYTVGRDTGVSYRVEVALAVAQENDPSSSRKLKAFINGYSEGLDYAKRTKTILKEIFDRIAGECHHYTGLRNNNDTTSTHHMIKHLIGQLYYDILDVIAHNS